jgi:5-methylcytosine-specific restriction endonuclease McrA
VKDRVLIQDLCDEKDRCQVCHRKHAPWGGIQLRLQLHHIFGGTPGRSDERTNIITLCWKCHHVKLNTPSLQLGHILFCKWRSDQEHTSWTRLAILGRRFLPELIEVIR